MNRNEPVDRQSKRVEVEGMLFQAYLLNGVWVIRTPDGVRPLRDGEYREVSAPTDAQL